MTPAASKLLVALSACALLCGGALSAQDELRRAVREG